MYESTILSYTIMNNFIENVLCHFESCFSRKVLAAVRAIDMHMALSCTFFPPRQVKMKGYFVTVPKQQNESGIMLEQP